MARGFVNHWWQLQIVFRQTRLILLWVLTLLNPGPAAAAPSREGEILGKEGTVNFAPGQGDWTNAVVGQPLNVADRLRTKALSRATIQLAELGRLRVNELTTLEILPPRTNASKATLDLKSGAIYFFTRDKPREFLIQTPHVVAASRGTEYLVTVEPDGRSVFDVFDGEVELSNPLGSVILTAGEQGAAQAGQPPVKTAVIQTVNVVQWWLYYPGVLDLDDLPLTAMEQSALALSLDHYRQGDLPAALKNYPAGRVPQSDAENVFLAALLLSAGQVSQAEQQLDLAPSLPELVGALREVIAAVNLRPFGATNEPATATAWLARSYLQQSRFDLDGALASALAATEKAPGFGFAWERVAELQFSFGRTAKALQALDKALKFSPRNAQAWALKGFLAAANNRLNEATHSFQTAINLDSALGNGWLGRGLVRIRSGDGQGGRGDLETAAALEPNRSVLHSYLGKAFDHLKEAGNAQKELRLAKQLDPADPTPWLYSALLLRQQLRFNEAVDDLEKSSALNDNRRVYRSRLMLDQDHAVRSSSLATIYSSAGMDEVSAHEAGRAVTYDYANHSAHLFLAESFNALRDPTRFNLRPETAWFNELLLANLLAPVGGGNLSVGVSQLEYSRMFEANQLGLSSATEARSDGQVRELASQFGTVGNFSYALDLDHQHNDGVRPNNELDRLEWYTTLKYQLTPRDSVLLLLKYQDYHSGDNFQYYNPDAPGVVRTNFTFSETQKPIAVAGYHHEWQPGVHTLLLAGRLENKQQFSDTDVERLILTTNASGNVVYADKLPFDVASENEFEIYTGELNQIIQGPRYNLVCGGRFQGGTFNATDQLTLSSSVTTNLLPFFNHPPAAADIQSDFQRLSGYGYLTYELVSDLWLTAGLSYDWITFPENYRQPPVSAGESTQDRLNPKAALVWSPLWEVTVRGIYAQALGGVSFDESFRLEPTQLAGFNQSFRTIMPESIVGSVSVPTYDIAGAALDVKLKTRTYLGVQAELLNSEVSREIGVFDSPGGAPPPPSSTLPSSTPEHLSYDEFSVAATVNQLIAGNWSLGAQYRFTHSELHSTLPDIPTSVYAGADRQGSANLQRAMVFVLFNHPSGFFARGDVQWYHQDNFGYPPALASADFFQGNIFVGYRLKRQHGEVSVGVLNLNDTDYHLNPLNLYSELPRERVFVARLRFNF